MRMIVIEDRLDSRQLLTEQSPFPSCCFPQETLIISPFYGGGGTASRGPAFLTIPAHPYQWKASPQLDKTAWTQVYNKHEFNINTNQHRKTPNCT